MYSSHLVCLVDCLDFFKLCGIKIKGSHARNLNGAADDRSAFNWMETVRVKFITLRQATIIPRDELERLRTFRMAVSLIDNKSSK
jgi:hypothetical protein